jgi:hypothetical protein
MRHTLHVTGVRGTQVRRRAARRAASHLVVVLLAGAACTGDDIVEPHSGPVRALVAPAAEATRTQHVRVSSLSDGHAIRGTSAVLLRRTDGLTVRVHTRGLDPHEAVDVFWAVFNDPAECMHPNALTGVPCSPADLFVEAALGSLHYVATLNADARGRLSYSASLAAVATAGCVGDPFPCHGVTDPFGAEVHSPMFGPGGGAGRQAAQFIAAQGTAGTQ